MDRQRGLWAYSQPRPSYQATVPVQTVGRQASTTGWPGTAFVLIDPLAGIRPGAKI